LGSPNFNSSPFVFTSTRKMSLDGGVAAGVGDGDGVWACALRPAAIANKKISPKE
jgi:hypothetical protein